MKLVSRTVALCGALSLVCVPVRTLAQRPAAPTGLAATATPTGVTLTWNAVPGATRYRVLRAAGTSTDFTRIATVRRTSHVDGAVTPGATYSYAVAAWNSSGVGPRSAPVVVTVPTSTDPGPTPPPPPSSTGLCSGLVQDKLAHPMTPVPRPAPGQAIQDPEFGTTIRRISDSGTARCNVVPMYSTVQAWNADESYMILYHAACTTGGVGGHHLYQGKPPYAHLRRLDIAPSDLEQVYWDTVDPRILHVPRTDRRFYAYNVDTGVATPLRDFSQAPTSCTTALSGGGDPMWTSWNRVIGLTCGSRQFAYDIANDAVGTVASVSTGGYAPQAGPSGALFLLNVNDDAAQVRDFNMNLLRTVQGVSPGEHSTIGRADGTDTWFSVQFGGSFVGAVVASNLATGTSRVIVGPATGWPYPPSGVHLSAVAYKNPGWLSVTIVGNPSGAGVLDSEVLLVNANTSGDGAGQVCRVGHHRSNESDNSYWPEPHGTISPSGTRILFGSNWGTLGTANVDSYVVELPAFRP